jgi:hypothetical protein
MDQNVQNINPQPLTNTQKNHSHSLLWIAIALLLVAGIGASYGTYTWQHKNTVSVQQELDSANKKIITIQAKEKFYALPAQSDFSPMCETSDNNNLIVASLTPEPVEKHQAFIIKCANKMSIPERVVAFKVHDDGSRSFAFGAGTGEPLCISSKIINANAANEISRKTLVPICKTF